MAHFARIFAPILPLWLLAATAGCHFTPSGPPDRLLAQGKEHFEAKRYSPAARHFRGVKVRHPGSDEEEEAVFRMAESYRLRRSGQQAFTAYKDLVDRFPNSRFSVEAAVGEFQLGLAHLEGRMPGFLFFGPDRSLGVPVMDHMQIHFRHHHLADDALMRVADFHLGRGEYAEAADVLRRLLSEYPRSEHTLRARFQLARAYWNQNQGPDYDLRLLLRSRRAFEDFIGTVRLDGLQERYKQQIESAQGMIVRINERLAESHYRVGRFYERTGYPGSARIHYEACRREFPGTKYAKISGARLAKLAGKKAG